MTKEEALNSLVESRGVLDQAIEGLGEEEMTQVQVEGVWTIKDVLGHIASWDETMLEPLRRCVSGDPYEVEVIEDYLAWNDEQAAYKRDVPLLATLNELATIRQELVTLVNGLSAEQWEERMTFPWGGAGKLTRALGGLAYHEMEHAHTIRRWRDDRGTGRRGDKE